MNGPSNKLRLPYALTAILSPRWLLTICFLGVIFYHTNTLLDEVTKLRKLRAIKPYAFAGEKFAGLQELLAGERYVGYYTDKDLDVNKDAQQFAQAQYTLAPVILDLNNTQHRYILFDCTSPDVALRTMKQVGALPLRRNQFGIILAVNPHAAAGKASE